MRRYILSITTVAISLFSISAFAGNLVCSETGRNPQVHVTAESTDMSALQNLTFQFNNKIGSIMDFRIDRETLAAKSLSPRLPRKVKNWKSYQVEQNDWIMDGGIFCNYEFLVPDTRDNTFSGYLSAYCVSGDGGQWKVEEELNCKFQ